MKPHPARILPLLIFLPVVVFSQPNDAAEYSTEGLMINIHLSFQPAYTLKNRPSPTVDNYDNTEDIENSPGFGIGLQAGYGINPWVTLLGNFAFNAVSKEQGGRDRSVDILYFEIYGRLNLALPNARFIPYALIGYGSRNVSFAHYESGGGNVIYVSDQDSYSGSVVSYGGGIYFGVGEATNIVDLSLVASKGNFEGVPIPETTTYRLNLGISMWILFD